MRLDRATAVLRPRTPWEAVDLGCAMARHDWGRLMAGWMTVALPLWALIIIVLRHHPGWATLLLWWTKPLLTRQPVFFLSRALFAKVPPARDFWRESRSALFRGLIASLTVRRLSVHRSFRLPVIMLEGLRGQRYADRCHVLSAHGGGSAAGLAFIGLNLEAVVWLGLGAIALTFLEGTDALMELSPEVVLRAGLPDWLLWASNGLYMLAIAAIEPIYAAGGFALYINSRTHLEGWDIEVIFRNMSERLNQSTQARPAGAVTALAIVLGAIFMASPAVGQETGDSPRAVVREIMEEKEFELDRRMVRVRDPKSDADLFDSKRTNTTDSSSGMLSSVAGWIIIALVVLAIIWLVLKHRFALRGRGGTGTESRAPPRVVMGMEVAPESLPDDVPAAAWREFEAGRPAAALRLLYRGAIAWLVQRAQLPVRESDTEGDCLRRARSLAEPEPVQYLESLTDSWVSCAYAQQPPSAERMRALCGGWRFSLRSDAAPPRTLPLSSAAAAWLVWPLTAMLMSGCTGRDYREEERIVGYKGAARLNPWLAAERLLSRMGYETETRPILIDLPDSWEHMLVVPLENVDHPAEARRLREWAARGGHLVVPLTGNERFNNDFVHESFSPPPAGNPLLVSLGAEVEHTSPGDVTIDFGEGKLHLDARDNVALTGSTIKADHIAGRRDEAALLSMKHGSGRITLMASARPWRNRWIGHADHAAVLLALAGNATGVTFVHAGRLTLWSMLWRYAWMALPGSAILLGLWLWRHMPRFGNILPADSRSSRHFGLQLDEAGGFLWDRSDRRSLLTAAQRAIHAAAAERGLVPHAAEFTAQMSARTGMPEARVTQALQFSGFENPAAFTIAAADLQRMMHALGVAL